MAFARHTQHKRTQGGAVQLEGVEVQVQINKDKDIEDLLPKQVCDELCEGVNWYMYCEVCWRVEMSIILEYLH